MSINWSILSNALASNPGETFRQGLEQGGTRAAMGALTQNPGDKQAMNALAMFNPQAAMGVQDRQAQQAAAALAAKKTEAQTQEQVLENRRNDIITGASFLEGVTDEATFQAARSRAQSAGINLDGVPATYDPNYVNGLKQTAQALIASQQRRNPQAAAVPNIQKEVDYYRSIGRPDLAEMRLQNHAEGSPVVFDVTGDGAPDLVPRSYFNRGGAPAPAAGVPPPPPGFVIEGEEGGAGSEAVPGTFLDPNARGDW